MPQGGRVRELDVLKGTAMLAVVTLHVSWYYLLAVPPASATGRLFATLHMVSGLGVPLFLVCSAIALSLRYSEPMGLAAWGAFLLRRSWVLLPAYLFWSLVTAALLKPATLWPGGRLAHLLLEGSADQQFYFVPLLFSVYLLWPLLQPAAVASGRSPATAVAVVALFAALSVVWWKLSVLGFPFNAGPHLFPLWAVYVGVGLALAPYLGALARSASARLTALAATVTVLAAVSMVATFYGSLLRPVSPAAIALAAMVFRRRRGAWLAAGLEAIGRRSYGIFLVHLLMCRALRWLLWPWLFGSLKPTTVLWPLFMPLELTLCLGLSFLATAFMSGLPWRLDRLTVGTVPALPTASKWAR